LEWARENNYEAYKELSSLNFREKKLLTEGVFNSIRGLGVLGQIIADPDITEVMINGYEDIFIEKSGRLSKMEQHFENRRELEIIITKFVSDAGRQVNESEPIVDTRLTDGSRVNVVMAPVALNGPIVTIRRFPKEAMTVQKLIQYGSITPEVAEVLKVLVECKYNIFVSGGTGSGKTTFLNALSNFIPHDERIITIEDSAELQIKNIPNLIRLEVRNANVEGKNGISIRDLIKSSLRMRPDRIVVGEVRDAAAIDMLQALNTGHSGMSTGHANTSRDMLSRLETMVLLGTDIPLRAVRKQVSSAIEIIVQLGRLRDKTRRVLEIIEILDCDDGDYKTNELYSFCETGQEEDGRVIGELVRIPNKLIRREKLLHSGYKDEA
jgi:pilus assembly protein CpaF